MKKPRIVMVGGGSVQWMPRLLNDMMLKPGLEEAEYVLLDISLPAAQRMARYGQMLAARRKLPCTFKPMRDPRRAFPGAQVIIITISTGGLNAMEPDIAIPEQYGIFQTVGDTVGPGGWSRALRNLPVFLEMGRTIAALAPDAWILNYTNPMSVLTQALCVTTDQPVVGLCHGVFENYAVLMKVFGLASEEEIQSRFGGINHFFWILDFTVRGRPGYPLLREKLRGRNFAELVAEAYVDAAGFSSKYWLAGDLFNQFGYLPYIGDRHTAEFLPNCLAPDEKRLQQWRLVRTSVRERKERLRKNQERLAEWIAGKRPLPEDKPSRETAADIAAIRVRGGQLIDVVNVPNVGQIPNLPTGAVVESLGVVNALGFTPLAVGELPEPIVRLVRPHVENQEAILQAVVEEDAEKAMHALMNDPLCSHLPYARIREMAAELLAANRRLLPPPFGPKKWR